MGAEIECGGDAVSIAKELQSGMITSEEYHEAEKRFNASERLCDECKHHVWNDAGYYACEKWKCQFESEGKG